jgi:hypothetical protein
VPNIGLQEVIKIKISRLSAWGQLKQSPTFVHSLSVSAESKVELALWGTALAVPNVGLLELIKIKISKLSAWGQLKQSPTFVHSLSVSAESKVELALWGTALAVPNPSLNKHSPAQETGLT